jgi:hypothetical protein
MSSRCTQRNFAAHNANPDAAGYRCNRALPLAMLRRRARAAEPAVVGQVIAHVILDDVTAELDNELAANVPADSAATRS